MLPRQPLSYPGAQPVPHIMSLTSASTAHSARITQIYRHCLSQPLDDTHPTPHGLLCRQDGYAPPGSGNWCGTSDLPSIARRDLPGGDRSDTGPVSTLHGAPDTGHSFSETHPGCPATKGHLPTPFPLRGSHPHSP